MTNDDLDQPTVAQTLSPRARTSMAQAEGMAGHEDDEPTVAFISPTAGAAMAVAGSGEAMSGGLQSAAGIVRQLDPDPERAVVRAAAPLLLIISQLRNSIEQADVHSLRQEAVDEIDRFEQLAQRNGIAAGDIIAARYILCATLDETVLMTPWGSRSEWSSNSLLNQFHNETWGGEKVFSILDRIRGDAKTKLPLLILVHTCLMLGFEGRYRVLEGGRNQLEDLRNELSRLIRRNSSHKADTPLSKNAKGAQKGKNVRTLPPFWVLLAIGLLLLIVVRGYSDFMLDGELVPALGAINSLNRL
ncbi:type IVB secretion system protein IcmH/DotU [Roseibium marinum]|uniref:Type IV/VI secretion system ImpK/VasF family protein n=1 Tax=Roseibium marinum TaxID=281252 RepID=A0A2S3V1P3_9HYPH|nr:type IVB secretion system protein IcmH/DotU [Roseibium marinum]POF33790.1 type IV/VI secretion system ImpK/VasF family protein [Roseibium marinum]